MDGLSPSRVMAQNILELTYGRTSDEEGRDYIKLNSYVMEVAINAMEGYLVDSVPACESFYPHHSSTYTLVTRTQCNIFQVGCPA